MTSEQFQQGRLEFTRVNVLRHLGSNVQPPEWMVVAKDDGLTAGIFVWVGDSYRFRPCSMRLDVHALDTTALNEIAQASAELTEITTLLLANGYFPGKSVVS